MKDLLNTYFLRRVVMWLARVSTDDFSNIVAWVREAEANLSGADKGVWVREQMSKLLPTITGWILNLVIEMALGFAIRKGYIQE